MALKLDLCFFGFVFPITVAVLGVFEFVAGLGEPSAGLGTPFDRPRLASAGTFRNQVRGHGLEEFVPQFLLLLAGTGLGHRHAEVTHPIHGRL